MLLRMFKVTYLGLTQRQKTIKIEAYSKYDAKKRFYLQYPKCEIVQVEEVQG